MGFFEYYEVMFGSSHLSTICHLSVSLNLTIFIIGTRWFVIFSQTCFVLHNIYHILPLSTVSICHKGQRCFPQCFFHSIFLASSSSNSLITISISSIPSLGSNPKARFLNLSRSFILCLSSGLAGVSVLSARLTQRTLSISY